MRVLLDENLDRRLKRHFDQRFDVSTVVDEGWSGTKNGQLLRLAEQHFDVFISLDRGIEHQQNWPVFDLAFVILRPLTSRLVDILPLMDQVNDQLLALQPGQLVQID